MEYDTPGRLTVNVAEAARLMGIGRNQMYEAVKEGMIPSIRIGRRWLIPREALDKMLAGQNAKA